MDEVLPRADAVCWVLDPQKYNDRVLHEDYLRPLAHHAARLGDATSGPAGLPTPWGVPCR